MTTPAKRNEPAEVAPRELTPAQVGIVNRVEATGRYGGVNPFLLQALQAETLAEAVTFLDVIAGSEHLNERMRFLDATFNDSDPALNSDIPVFAVCDVVRELGTGEVEKLSIGAGHVVGVLIRACEMGWFPFDAELVSVPLGNGMKAINLNLSPTRVDTITDSL